MIRVVAEHSPALFAILGVFPGGVETLAGTLELEGGTYYKAEVKTHYVLYRRAISGWGAAAPNPNDPRPVFAPGQR